MFIGKKQWTVSQKNIIQSQHTRLYVEAGAGSGKTAVLTEKICSLILSGIPVDQILAITFTEKAALELKTRIESQLEHSVYDIHANTFHHFCASVLRRYGHWLGVDPSFDIMEQARASYLFDLFLKKRYHNYLDHNPILFEFAVNFGVDYIFGLIKDAIHDIGKIGEILEILDISHPDRKRFQDWFNVVGQIIVDWDDYKKDHAVLEFDDLLAFVLQGLKQIPILKKVLISENRYIFVDEFQDTDPNQGLILQDLMNSDNPPCLFIVGDTRQSIYGFRGADLKFVNEFKAYFLKQGAFALSLEDNFRSTSYLVAFINNFFSSAFGSVYIEQKHHRQLTQPPESIMVFLMDHEKEKKDSEYGRYLEAKMMVEWIKSNGRSWSDYAILVRNLNHAEAFRTAFLQTDIPFEIISGSGFFDREEVIEVIHFLKWLCNSHDRFSFLGMLRSSFFCWSDVEIYLLFRENDNPNKSILDWKAEHVRIHNKWHDTKIQLNYYIENSGFWNVSQLIYTFLIRQGFYESLSAFADSVERKANIEKLLNMADLYGESRPVDEFVKFIQYRLGSSDDREAEVRSNYLENKVYIMTIHQAKGLEFPVVLLPFLSSFKKGYSPPWIFHSEVGGTFKAPHEDETDDDLWKSIKASIADDEFQEELRLFYVAATRAQDQLVFSGMIPKELKQNRPFDRLISFLGVDIKNFESSVIQRSQYSVQVRKMFPKSEILGTVLSDIQTGHISGVLADTLLVQPWQKSDRNVFSVTTIARYLKCPSLYAIQEWAQVDYNATRINISDNKKSSSLIGNLVHSVLEKVPLIREKPDFTKLPFLQQSEFSSTVIKICESLWNYSVFHEWVLQASGHERELPFSLRLGNRIIEGKIDLIAFHQNQIFIIDYKTGKEMDGDNFSNPYFLQLAIYALAMQKLFKKEVVRLGLIYLGNTCKLQTLEWNKTQQDLWTERILEILDRMQEKPFGRIRDITYCNECPVITICNQSEYDFPLLKGVNELV